jgi:predicted RNase H-like HicB family nuclease
MSVRKFTVILLPQDEGGYQVFFPYYPNCTTDGDTVEEALANGKDALEGLLFTESKHGGDKVEPYVLASHVVVAEVDIEVPAALLEEEVTAAKMAG